MTDIPADVLREIPEEIEGAILDLKLERNAIILAHYYQEA